jgi:hypothetical protein
MNKCQNSICVKPYVTRLQGFKRNDENSFGNSSQFKLELLEISKTTVIHQPIKKTTIFIAIIFS